MIPKKIHYCWFGGNPIPEQFQTYMHSWKKNCPDYDIIQWDESNFDIDSCEFVRKAYKERKWAFVSDYARLWIIYHEGGFYLDTDVELLKPLDELRPFSAWFALDGENISTGLGFGAGKHNNIVQRNMQVYEKMHFEDTESFHVYPCPYYTTEVLKQYGYTMRIKGKKVLDGGVLLLDNSYCNPYDWATRKTKIKKHTISIHHYAGTWQSDEEKTFNIERHNYEIINKKFGKRIADVYSYLFWSKKENGGKGIVRTILNKLIRS